VTKITTFTLKWYYFYINKSTKFKIIMKKNVGSIDKIVRYVIAIVAIYIAYSGMVISPWSYVLYAFAAIMVLTALAGSCPIFSIFGLSSNKAK